ncbi:MAG: HAD hydrolase family protein [Bacteroidales bacterium]|nr:HAD hydrolase family protein [Bacteroidales bacterium]
MLLTENRLRQIKAIAFDIDGVMTDGGILAMPDGDLLRVFDAKDSFGVRMAKMNGLHTGIITGGSSESIIRRFCVCGVDPEDIYLHSRIKVDDFKHFCEKHSLKAEEVMFFGDDLPDIPVMKACGIGVAPADAVEEVRHAADYVSEYKGGHGCVRNAVEMVLKAQGRWQLDDQLYKKLF